MTTANTIIPIKMVANRYGFSQAARLCSLSLPVPSSDYFHSTLPRFFSKVYTAA